MTSSGFFFCGYGPLASRKDHSHQCLSYLLVNQNIRVTFLVLIWKIPLNLPEAASLFEELPFYSQLLSSTELSRLDHRYELSGLFELSPELAELLNTLSISTSGFADLPDLPSPKTDIWIAVICVYPSLELNTVSVACLLLRLGVLLPSSQASETCCQPLVVQFSSAHIFPLQKA